MSATSAAPTFEAPKSSLNFKLDDLDGQKVREWFKEDFGATNTIELAPKFKGGNGHIKAKVTVTPSDKDKKTAFAEEIEIQSKADNRDVQFKLKAKELSGTFDLGAQSVGAHWLNPYVSVALPRSGASLRSTGNTSFGFLFHSAPNRFGSSRLHADFNFDQKAEGESAIGTDVQIKTNFVYNYRFLTFALWEQWKLNKAFDATGKLSLAAKHGNFQGFIQGDFQNYNQFTGVYAGVSAGVRKGLSLYGFGSKDLSSKDGLLSYGFGLDWAHCKGYSAKANWTSVTAKSKVPKVSAVFTFNPSAAVSASIVLDHSCTKDTQELGWGVKAKFNL